MEPKSTLVNVLLKPNKPNKRYKGKAQKFIKKHGNPNNQGIRWSRWKRKEKCGASFVSYRDADVVA